MIKRGLLAAGLILAAGAPAFAQNSPLPSAPPPGMHPVETETVTTHSETHVVTPPSTETETVVMAPSAPPPPRPETPPPPPEATMVWKPGHWAWEVGTARYVWLPGKYVLRPTATASWTPGHWESRPEGWMWVDGHW